MFKLEFKLDVLPVSRANKRMHWAKLHKHDKQLKWLVASAVSGKKPKEPLVRAKLTLTRFSSNQPDFDNLVISFKPIVDGLTEAGVIANDKAENLMGTEYKWERVATKNCHIKILIEEVCDET